MAAADWLVVAAHVRDTNRDSDTNDLPFLGGHRACGHLCPRPFEGSPRGGSRLVARVILLLAWFSLSGQRRAEDDPPYDVMHSCSSPRPEPDSIHYFARRRQAKSKMEKDTLMTPLPPDLNRPRPPVSALRRRSNQNCVLIYSPSDRGYNGSDLVRVSMPSSLFVVQ